MVLYVHVNGLISRSEMNYHQHNDGEDHRHHKNHHKVVKKYGNFLGHLPLGVRPSP